MIARLAVAVALVALAHRGGRAEPAVTVGGYVEAYYQLDLQGPSNHVTNLRAFDDRDRAFTVSNVALGARAAEGSLTTQVTVQIGSAPASLQVASLAYRARSGLVVDAGLFPSPIGPEVIPIKDNWNWSRSDLFFALPAYHTGVRAAVPLGGGWTGTLHVYNGWDPVDDGNAYPSLALSGAFSCDRVTGQVLYFTGIERPTGAREGRPWRHLLDAYASIAIRDDLDVMLHADGGVERNAIGTSAWLAAAAYARFAVSPRVHAAVRVDGFREWIAADVARTADPIFWPTTWVASATGTLAFEPSTGLSIRLEVRHDHAATAVFLGGDAADDVPDRRARDTVTLGATAWF